MFFSRKKKVNQLIFEFGFFLNQNLILLKLENF